MKNILLIFLIIIAVVMIYLGITAKIFPPTLTGVGFVIIAILFYQKKS